MPQKFQTIQYIHCITAPLAPPKSATVTCVYIHCITDTLRLGGPAFTHLMENVDGSKLTTLDLT